MTLFDKSLNDSQKGHWEKRCMRIAEAVQGEPKRVEFISSRIKKGEGQGKESFFEVYYESIKR